MTTWARWLPVTLAIVSWVVGWVLVDVLTRREAMLWAILVLTTYDTDHDIRTAMAAGAAGSELGRRPSRPT